MRCVIAIPTSPRFETGMPEEYLTTMIESLAETLRDEPDVKAQVLLLDCRRLGETHEGLDRILERPPEGLDLRGYTRHEPVLKPTEVEQRVTSDRIRRDGLEATCWTYQQSLDFLELMGHAKAIPDIDWIFRVEDDAIFSDRWLTRFLALSRAHPRQDLFSLFSIRLRLDGQTTPHHTGAVALAFRPSGLPRAMKVVQDCLPDLPFDVALGNLGGTTLYPSLVQHIGFVRSIDGGHPAGMWTSPTFRRSASLLTTVFWQCRIAFLMTVEAARRTRMELFPQTKS